jgi:hypothetical protein
MQFFLNVFLIIIHLSFQSITNFTIFSLIDFSGHRFYRTAEFIFPFPSVHMTHKLNSESHVYDQNFNVHIGYLL